MGGRVGGDDGPLRPQVRGICAASWMQTGSSDPRLMKGEEGALLLEMGPVSWDQVLAAPLQALHAHFTGRDAKAQRQLT